MTPSIGWFAFVHDFLDEGPDDVAERLAASGADHVDLALVYHTARDLVPHSPTRAIRYLPSGAHHFAPEPALYPDDAQPLPDPQLGASDPLASIVPALERHGLRFDAWVVLCHNSRLAMASPHLAQQNAFGDPMLTDLCPANPTVQEYVDAVMLDVARHRPATVLAESMHFHGLRHGYHHERYLVDVSSAAELALSLCFCQWCTSAASERGVDVSVVREWAIVTAQACMRGEPTDSGLELDPPFASIVGPPDLAEYLDVRSRIVTSLARRSAAVLQARGIELVVLDPSGAAKGYATGEPAGAPAAEISWFWGLDPTSIAAAATTVGVLGYVRDPARLESELAAYRAAVGAQRELALAMRAWVPDCRTDDELLAKLDVAIGAEIRRVDFYHYGLAPLAALERCSRVLRRVCESTS